MSKLGGNNKQHFKAAKDWQTAPTNTFWGSIASKDHLIQVYEEEDILASTMADFVISGVASGDCTVVFLTPQHLAALDSKLIERGFSPETLVNDKLYFKFDAVETLDKFVIDDWPDTPLLYLTISELLAAPRNTGRKMRAGGEMVALLRERNLIEATIQLEKIWKEIYDKDPFLIFCVYPRRIFVGDIYDSEFSICCLHSKVLSGSETPSSQVKYRDLEHDHLETENLFLSS